MLDLTALAAEVTEIETVDGSATSLINTLMDEVAANKNDPAAIQALVDRAKAATASLAAAVASGTAPPATPATA